MATMLEHPSTIKSLEPDTQFVIPAATVWSNPSHITCKGDDFPPEALHTKQGSEKTANLPLNQELRPQVEPKSRPRRGSKIQPSQDAVSPERARYLERNRIAANKCRLKKKQECEEIQRMLQKETAKRNALLAEVKKLKEETWRLKNGVFAHAKCGDHRINLQLTKMTQQLLEKSSLQCPMASSPNPFVRKTRGLPRRDYNALNNGTPSLLPEPWEGNIREIESPCSPAPSEFTGGEEASPSVRSLPIPRSSPAPLDPTLSGLTSSQSSPPPYKRRKAKSYSSWTLEHFWITELDNTWRRKGGPPKKDRLLVCRQCSWSSRDSARYGSTSNLLAHLQAKHRIRSGSDITSSSTIGTTLDSFLTPAKERAGLEQMLIQWVVQTRQPFTVVEHPAFRALFEATGAILPIKTADTLFNRIKEEFRKNRTCVKEELASSSRTLALSLDVWTSENQIAIMGIIGHWISPEFEKREELLEFTDICGPHSGENLAEIVIRMLEELDVAPKLLTITGDNAANNGTLCDSLHAELLKNYDDKDDQFRIRPLMRFRGRPP
ncbi:hypothetical protein N7522_013767 [Penicillium canescens]|nr:hypothetical protein N7522_013767 [Penicillium canescens]